MNYWQRIQRRQKQRQAWRNPATGQPGRHDRLRRGLRILLG